MEETLASLIEKKLKKDLSKNYWLVRTSSGEDYEGFKANDFIGVGWNEIKYSDLKKLPPEEQGAGLKKDELKRFKLTRRLMLDELAAKIEFSDEKDFASEKSRMMSAVKAIHQIETFVREIKKGDIVLIPSENSDFYSFGEVLESSIYLADSFERSTTVCDLVKRKRVKWIIKDLPRHKLDPNYWKFVRVQSTITNISDYRYFIETTVSNDFVLDGSSHFVLRVTQNIEVTARHYKAFFRILDCAEELIRIDADVDIEPAEIKARVQSPGEWVSISSYLPYAVCVALVVIAIVGGGLSHSKEAGFKFGSKGVWGRILEALKQKKELDEFSKNQQQNRRNQEAILTLLELNPELLKDCEGIALKLIENQTKDGQAALRGGNDIV